MPKKMNPLQGRDEDELTEEELDMLYRPKQMNSRKALAPLFLYLILKHRTTPETPITQNQLISRLSEYPYEISLERKAVGRTLHLLADAGIGVYASHRGAWYDKEGWS